MPPMTMIIPTITPPPITPAAITPTGGLLEGKPEGDICVENGGGVCAGICDVCD